MNHRKVKFASFLALCLASLALVCTPALPRQDATAALNLQHPQPTPTPHPTPHPTLHPIVQPILNPDRQPSPHPSPHPLPHPGTNPVSAADQDAPVVTVQPRTGVATSPAVIGTARIKVITRSPIQFVPFELSDVQTRKHQPMTLDSELRLKNGVQITVSKYLDQINEYERGFNALGYTLRGEPRVIELQELEPETAVLPLTANEDRSNHPIRTKTVPELDGEFRDEGGNSADRAQILAGLPPATAEPLPSVFLRPLEDSGPPETDVDDSLWGRPRPEGLGRPKPRPGPPPPGTIFTNVSFSSPWAIDGFRISVYGDIFDSGTTSWTLVRQRTIAAATIFGWRVPLMSMQSLLKAPRNGQLDPEIQLRVGSNDTVILSDKSGSSAQWMKSGGTVSQDFLDLNRTFRFSIGPIPASLTIGITGSAGVRNYWAGLRPLYAKGQYTPFIAADVYAKGGPDIGVVNFGIRGDLNLLKYEIGLGSESILKFTPLRQERYLWESYSATGTLSTLSGKLSLYACVDLLLGDVCFDQKLADFKGYNLSNSALIPLKTNRVDLPLAPPPQPAIRRE